MDPTEVCQQRPEFQQFPFENFKTNFENLTQNMLLQFDRLQFDSDAFGHDLAILEDIRRDAPAATPWHKSEARKLHKQDVKSGKHQQLWPTELHQSKATCRKFCLKENALSHVSLFSSRCKELGTSVQKERKRRKTGIPQRKMQPRSQQQEVFPCFVPAWSRSFDEFTHQL